MVSQAGRNPVIVMPHSRLLFPKWYQNFFTVRFVWRKISDGGQSLSFFLVSSLIFSLLDHRCLIKKPGPNAKPVCRFSCTFLADSKNNIATNYFSLYKYSPKSAMRTLSANMLIHLKGEVSVQINSYMS